MNSLGLREGLLLFAGGATRVDEDQPQRAERVGIAALTVLTMLEQLAAPITASMGLDGDDADEAVQRIAMRLWRRTRPLEINDDVHARRFLRVSVARELTRLAYSKGSDEGGVEGGDGFVDWTSLQWVMDHLLEELVPTMAADMRADKRLNFPATVDEMVKHMLGDLGWEKIVEQELRRGGRGPASSDGAALEQAAGRVYKRWGRAVQDLIVHIEFSDDLTVEEKALLLRLARALMKRGRLDDGKQN